MYGAGAVLTAGTLIHRASARSGASPMAQIESDAVTSAKK